MRRAYIALLLALIALATHAEACSYAIGSFHQVTALRGKVIGGNWHSKGPLQPLGYIRFLRQSKRSGARLTLYEYRWPIKDSNKLKQVAERIADKNGNFDFGVIAEGHYILVVHIEKDWDDEFDVEITNKVPATKQITIDVSPVFPDCKGGHEFIVEANS